MDSIGYAGAYESFVYDDDGLLTGAGSYSITRNAANGLPEAVSDGTVTQGRVFSGYGEVDGIDYTVGASAPYSWSVVRGNAGRITQKIENIGVDTVTWDYTYDQMGRLETVYKDNNLAEAYSYDGQGNRLNETNILRGVSRSYTHSVSWVSDPFEGKTEIDQYCHGPTGILSGNISVSGTVFYIQVF